MSYQIHLDREACEGIFACLVRDDRFVEDADGLATLAIDDLRREGDNLVGTAAEDIERARQAAAACPVDAITVTPQAEREGSDD